jgi:hypothetical protein
MSISCKKIITEVGDVNEIIEELRTQNFLQSIDILVMKSKISNVSNNINYLSTGPVPEVLVGNWKQIIDGVDTGLSFTINTDGTFIKNGGINPGTYNPHYINNKIIIEGLFPLCRNFTIDYGIGDNGTSIGFTINYLICCPNCITIFPGYKAYGNEGIYYKQ